MSIQLMIQEDKKLNKSTYVVLSFMLLCAGLTGLFPQIVLSRAILALCCALFIFDSLYLAFPLMLFYYSCFGIVAGLSVFRIYSLLFILSTIFRHIKPYIVNHRLIWPLLVYLLYAVFVVSQYSMQRAVFSFVDVLVCIFLSNAYLSDKTQLKMFFTAYALVALVAYMTGIIIENHMVLIDEKTKLETVRYMSTFEDPNYMGFFYTVGVFTTVSLKLFKPIIRIIVVLAFYIMIATTVSITAIVVNPLLWLFYLAVVKKVKPKVLITCILVVVVLFSVYSYGATHRDAPVIGPLCYRISLKLRNFENGNINEGTSGRTSLSEEHFQFFRKGSIWRKLFGGTAVNSGYLDSRFRGMAHNEFIDLLLNVGIVGTLMLVVYMLWSLLELFSAYRRTLEERYLCLLMSKMIWVLYAATLTVFLDFRFSFIYFL